MNTQPQPKSPYNIKARHIGPIMELDGVLSNKGQNLIFARNGMGKSFLSRAFRYIAEYKNQYNSENISKWLVSEESLNGTAKLQFLQGTDELATLELNSQSDIVDVRVDSPTIFHVFSQDFVDRELREKEYELNGDITHKIIVGSKNIDLEKAREELTRINKTHDEKYQDLQTNFNKEKLKLKNDASIRGNFGPYVDLSIESDFAQILQPESSTAGKTLIELIKELDKLKSIPADPPLPQDVALLLDEIPYDDIQKILEKPISLASIAEEVKEKIDKNPDFYKYGITLIADIAEGQKTCPLCEQSLENEKAKQIILTYVKYFEDAEAKAKALLRQYWKIINEKIKYIESHRQNINKQEKLFNDIKNYISSQKEIGFENTDNDYNKIIVILTELKNIIEIKAKELPKECKMPDNDSSNALGMLNAKIEDNNNKINNIKKIFGDTGNERRNLQKLSCEAFRAEFIKTHKILIGDIQAIRLNLRKQVNEINQLERTGDSDDAKVRVSKILKTLLSHFFYDKYSFDEQNFTIKKDGKTMPARGSHRTLSDGEKSVLAFCYFIAMIHLKVQSNDDYKKLFLVFDDPVTSMSYDFVFFIVQVLKNLRILNDGDILIENRRKDEQESRIKLLILTHNSYFFNIAFANDVVKHNAAFSLDLLKGKHVLSKLDEYIAPFRNQLKDIILVAEGKEESNHTTANSIRSVLEAIKRFCHPDKELNEFFGDMVKDMGIDIQSVLIHDNSHGHPREMDAPPIDFKKACEDAIKIANAFIPGQINKITGVKKQKN